MEETFEPDRQGEGECGVCAAPTFGPYECLRCGIRMCSACHPNCGCAEMLAALASAPAPAPSPAPKPRIVLFLGPYAKAEVVDDMAKGLAVNLSKRLCCAVRVIVGDPPYEVPDDPDSTGFWMRPSHRLPVERRKLLRKQIFSSLTLALTHVVRFEPCLIYGRGRGG